MAQETKIEFYTPGIVHVVKSLNGKQPKSLVVNAVPQGVAVSHNGNTWKSSELTVKLNPASNTLTFLSAKGKVLLREKSCSFKPIPTNDNPGKHVINHTFLLDKAEAIY